MRIVLSLCLTCTMLGCARPRTSALVSQATGQSVWSMDLVRTRPGQQAEYLRGITANWAGAHRLAVEQGDVRSYQAFATRPDSTRDWDVVLLIEYADVRHG
jgi:hypothetical protein